MIITDINQPCQQSNAGLTVGRVSYILTFNMSRKSKEQLGGARNVILRVDEVLQNAGMEPDEYDPDLMLLRKPREVLAKVFGIDKSIFSLDRIQERDYPTLISYSCSEGDDTVVRLGIYHVFGSAKVEIVYNRSDGTIFWLNREGARYLGHAFGSRWYSEPDWGLLSEHPELKKLLTKKQKNALADDKADLISYYFFPNSDRQYYSHLEGCARILYYWDREKNSWEYVTHSERDFGTPSDEPDRFREKFWRSPDDTVIVSINPFGIFEVPGEIEIEKLIENLFFPRRVEESIEVRKDIYPGINHDFIGVKQLLP